MKATVNVLCYKSKTLKNGEHPLMVCVCKDRKRKYISIGMSVNPRFWDFDKNKPKRNCPNKEQLSKLIAETEQRYSEQILDYSTTGREYTLATLAETVDNSSKCKTVNDLFQHHIKQLMDENRLGYALSVRQVYTSLIKYKGNLDCYFSEIDVTWLKKYEGWLRKQKLSENTIGIRFRTLRMIYNLAISEGLVKGDLYPFKKYKVSKLHKVTTKRAITKEEIKQIMDFDTSSACFYKRLAVDIFSFSYLMGGINFTDISKLTQDNIDNNKLIYTRQKTKKTIILPLLPQAYAIIMKYKSDSRKYLFPILDNRKRTPMQTKDRITDAIATINYHLKAIGAILGIEQTVTTYVARHSYATVLKRAGVSTSIFPKIHRTAVLLIMLR